MKISQGTDNQNVEVLPSKVGEKSRSVTEVAEIPKQISATASRIMTPSKNYTLKRPHVNIESSAENKTLSSPLLKTQMLNVSEQAKLQR